MTTVCGICGKEKKEIKSMGGITRECGCNDDKLVTVSVNRKTSTDEKLSEAKLLLQTQM